MIRATLIISGDVQGAGYRGVIIKTGRKLGLVGSVENIPDGTVKIVCEGEKERIEDLINSIKISDEIVDVENIDVKYGNATGEFDGKGFDVKASEKISDLYREMFHGYITSEKYFRVGFKKQDKMIGKQDQMLDKQDKTIGAIKGLDKKEDKMLGKQDVMIDTLKGFRNETKTEFQTIKTDYGKISQDLGRAVESINTIAKSIEKLAEAIAKK